PAEAAHEVQHTLQFIVSRDLAVAYFETGPVKRAVRIVTETGAEFIDEVFLQAHSVDVGQGYGHIFTGGVGKGPEEGFKLVFYASDDVEFAISGPMMRFIGIGT